MVGLDGILIEQGKAGACARWGCVAAAGGHTIMKMRRRKQLPVLASKPGSWTLGCCSIAHLLLLLLVLLLRQLRQAGFI